jgi:hypothetical protein
MHVAPHCRQGKACPWELVEKSIRATQPYDVFFLRSMLAVPYFEKVARAPLTILVSCIATNGTDTPCTAAGTAHPCDWHQYTMHVGKSRKCPRVMKCQARCQHWPACHAGAV